MESLAMDENTESLYWQMLMEVESKTNPEKDVLGKLLVEAAYNHWNKKHPKTRPVKPRWAKD